MPSLFTAKKQNQRTLKEISRQKRLMTVVLSCNWAADSVKTERNYPRPWLMSMCLGGVLSSAILNPSCSLPSSLYVVCMLSCLLGPAGLAPSSMSVSTSSTPLVLSLYPFILPWYPSFLSVPFQSLIKWAVLEARLLILQKSTARSTLTLLLCYLPVERKAIRCLRRKPCIETRFPCEHYVMSLKETEIFFHS